MFLMYRLVFALALAVLVGGCGGVGGSPDAPRLYVAIKSASQKARWDIETFAIDSITGHLDPIDVHVERGEERFTVQNLLLHPSGNHLVLGKRGSFAAMSIDASGDLTLLPKEQTAHRGSYHGQGAIVPHPDGRRIFVFSLPTRDSAAGTWVLKVNDAPPWFEMMGEASTPGCLGYAAAFDPEGNYLYCGSQRPGEELLTLAVDDATGSLTKRASVPVKPVVRAIRYHPSGEFVYALSGEAPWDPSRGRDWNQWRPSSIAAYRRNPRNGRLSSVIRGEVTIDSMITDIALTPDGHYLYASDKTLGRVLGFRITATGQLEELTKWARAGKAPVQLLVDPGSRFVYVANTGSDSLSLFSILDSGNLAPMSGSPIALGGAPTAATMTFPAGHD